MKLLNIDACNTISGGTISMGYGGYVSYDTKYVIVLSDRGDALIFNGITFSRDFNPDQKVNYNGYYITVEHSDLNSSEFLLHKA